MAYRLRAHNSAALTSSIHLVCRPRHSETDADAEHVGEWRDVLSELPKRIHEWMPRLAAEGVVGADAIFACLGPALEVFSQYNRVEKASGETVALREYLEHVWASVSTEALSMIFNDADAAGLEPDARLTAMWLWTLGGPSDTDTKASDDDVVTSTGYTLEYDAARKIAQGLGIKLEDNESIVEVSGSQARLRPASERTRHLFARDLPGATGRAAKKKARQRSLFEELEDVEAESTGTESGELTPHAGATVLDRLHQAMILFAAGRGEALRRFLVDDGAASDGRFWKLAQSLSALYPKETDEKRWVDGVLGRKKGLGL
jgi:putative DNA methylase